MISPQRHPNLISVSPPVHRHTCLHRDYLSLHVLSERLARIYLRDIVQLTVFYLFRMLECRGEGLSAIFGCDSSARASCLFSISFQVKAALNAYMVSLSQNYNSINTP